MRLFVRLTGIFLIPLCAIALGCTQKAPSSFPADAPALTPRSRVFPMDWQKVSDLEIQKFIPEQDQPWSARLLRTTQTGAPTSSWKIESASVGYTLTDTVADARFIGHLIDTLSTLQMEEFALNGTPESFGLAKPAWVLKWSYEGRKHELRIGDVATGAKRFAELPGRTDETGKSRVVLIAGAALEMLARVDSFTTLRAQVLLPFESDDIDWVEWKSIAGKPLQAERYNEGWVIPGTRTRPSRDISQWIEKVTHLRAKTFLDESLSASELTEKLRELEKNPSVIVKFQGPTLKEATLRIQWTRTSGIAAVSNRPGMVFELHPDARAHF